MVLIDSIIDYYKNNVSSNILVFKYCKWAYRSFTLSMYIYAFCIIPISLTFLVWRNLIAGLVIFLACIMFSLITGLILNERSKKILASKYMIKADKKIWKCEAYQDMQDEILIGYLKERALFTENRIKQLKDILKDEERKSRLPNVVVPGILLAFFIPAWVQFLGVVYKANDSINQALIITIFIFGILLILAQISGILKYVYNETIDPIINKKSYIIKEVLHFLDIISLKLPDS